MSGSAVLKACREESVVAMLLRSTIVSEVRPHVNDELRTNCTSALPSITNFAAPTTISNSSCNKNNNNSSSTIETVDVTAASNVEAPTVAINVVEWVRARWIRRGRHTDEVAVI
jgi:hypothetical protein